MNDNNHIPGDLYGALGALIADGSVVWFVLFVIFMFALVL